MILKNGLQPRLVLRSVRRDPGQLLRPTRRHHCPICRFRGVFLSFSALGTPRRNAQCPRCGSLERHRLVALCLKRLNLLPAPGERILHFAPEAVFARLFGAFPGYVTADIRPGAAHDVQDITAMTYPDASISLLVANHVLEHVPDDRAAMAEIRRVLTPAGATVLTVPLDPGRKATFEDASMTSPQERLKAFGHVEHVRIYGCDFPSRLREAGLDVAEFYPTPEDISTYGLIQSDVVFLARRAD